MRRRLVLVSGLLLAIGVVVPVMARVPLTMSLKTQSARVLGSCREGAQAWQVTSIVKLRNGGGSPAVVRDTRMWVTYTTDRHGDAGGRRDVTVLRNGSLVSGARLPSRSTRTFQPAVRLTLPCSATTASLFSDITVVGDDDRYAASDPFIDAGTPVPSGAVGILGIAVIAAIAGLLALRLGPHGRPIPIETERS